MEDLAMFLCGLDYENSEFCIDEVDNLLEEKFGVCFLDFEKIASELIKLAEHWESPLTGDKFRGFIDENKGIALAKIKVC